LIRPSETPLPLAPGEEEGPTFAEPWHAQVFAITVKLSEEGHFTWPEWAEAFGAALKHAAAEGGPADGSNYYEVWLDALETMLRDRGLAAAADLRALKQAWTEAYLTTPHGKPVRLK
jgi:nitrile hydratase accessory protein